MNQRMNKLLGLRKLSGVSDLGVSDGPTWAEQYATSGVGRFIEENTPIIGKGTYDSAYPNLHKKSESELLGLFVEEYQSYLDSDNNGIFLAEAIGYNLAKNHGYNSPGMFFQTLKSKFPIIFEKETNLEDICDEIDSSLYSKLRTAIEEGMNARASQASRARQTGSSQPLTPEQEFTKKVTDLYWGIKKELEDNFLGKPGTDIDSAKRRVNRSLGEESFLQSLNSNEKEIYKKQKERGADYRDMFFKNLYEQIDRFYATGGSSSTSSSSGGGGSSSTSSSSGGGGSSSDSGGRRRSSKSSGGSDKGQASGEPILIDEEHRGLTGLVDENDSRFVYTTALDGSWADYTVDGKPGNRRLDRTYSGWPEVVRQINSFSTKGATKTAPDKTAPSAPAATSEPAPEQAPVSNLVINVARLLSNVDAGHTYAGKTIFTNERGMVRRMLAQIRSMPQKGVVDAPLALARVIVGENRAALEGTNLSKADPSTVSSMTEREIERTFRGELDIIMRGVVNLSKGGKLSTLINIRPPAGAAPKPATPPEGGEGTNAKANFLDSRIKKLAKLRRLKVRAQMEAAIEPSAKFGRSRVF